jgi:hypothetical protein
MKSKIIFLLIILSIFGAYSNLFSQNQKTFSENFCKPDEFPMMAISGDHIVILCDTAFIVNKYRMNLYEISKDMILKNNNQNFSKLIKAYDRTLMVVSNSYDSLLFNYRQLEDIFRTTMQENQQTLNNTRNDLEKATNTLNSTEKMLNDAVVKLNEREKNPWKKKAAFFGGGLITGILVMLVIN